jgi:CheY-like chemotaxis protein
MKKYRVFVVEDDEQDFEFLKEAFTEADCTDDILHYQNAGQLMSALGSIPSDQYPALIVLDHQTSGSNGTDAVRHIRANKDLESIVVVVYSGSIPAELEKKLLQYGVDLCLVKGNSAKDILGHVRMFHELVEKNLRSTKL